VTRRRIAAYRAISLVVALLLLWPAWAVPSVGASAPPAKPTDPPGKYPAVPGELIVGFHPGVNVAARDQAITRRGGKTVATNERFAFHVVQVAPGVQAVDEIDEYLKNPAVRYVEPNYLYRSTVEPNDPNYANGALWGLHNTGQSIDGQTGIADADIDGPEAWATTTGSQNVVVGVVDTGIDYNHPDLAPNIWSAPAGWTLNGCAPGTHGYRIANGVTSCDPMDDEGHGTHVSGTIGARGNDSTGVVGVNWQVKLMGLKFLGFNGSGSVSDAVGVLEYALNAKEAGVNLRVLNNSWGGGGHSQALYEVIDALGDAGVLFVAAAGNNGSNNDSYPNYPSNYDLPNIVSVAATDNRDNIAGFSNYGSASVDLGAPGVGVFSTLPNGSYGSNSGTSMASPHVAGVAALLLADQAGLTTLELKNRLIYCGDPVAALTDKTLTGRRLNAAAALVGCATTGTIAILPTAGGFASVSPAQASYPFGTDITLTATAAPGYAFAGWQINGQNRGSANPYTFPINENLTVLPLFIRANPFENFDGVVAPALPAGWTTSRTGETCPEGDSAPWRTVPGTVDTTPNAAFAGDPNCVSDNILQSPSFAVANDQTRLRFRHKYNLETRFDGGVLEIKIGGEAYADILTAGGSFASHGYDESISTSFNSPIAGRLAWTGVTNTWVTTVVTLPPAAAGQPVQLRWRLATDTSLARLGWWIDSITIDPGDGGTPTALSVEPATGPYGGSTTLTATLTGEGNPLADKVINFAIDGVLVCGVSGKPSCPVTGADGVATLLAASLAGQNAGTHPAAIVASFAGDADFASSFDNAPLTVTKAAQTITFAPLPDLPGDTPQFLVAATASSGLPVTFTSATPGTCTTSGTNGAIVTLVGQGTCTIVANQAGNLNHEPATPAPQSFEVTSAPPTRQNLNLTVSGNGTVLVTPPGVISTGETFMVNQNGTATLQAQPASGQTFIGWTIDGIASGWANPLTITMDTNHDVRANFAATVTFLDVAASRPDYVAITELASRGSILGYGNGRYGPGDGVQRAQMAALISRATPAGPGTPPTMLTPPACVVANSWDCESWGNSFTDPSGISPGLWRNAGTLQHYGVALGYTQQDCTARGKAYPCYGPTDPVSHAQTIAFVTRAMIAKGYWQPQPNAPLPYSGVPAVLATEVRTFHFYAGLIPAAPTTAAGWNAPANRGWFAMALWSALDSYWGNDE
jgi:subtilisin family serine protease